MQLCWGESAQAKITWAKASEVSVKLPREKTKAHAKTAHGQFALLKAQDMHHMNHACEPYENGVCDTLMTSVHNNNNISSARMHGGKSTFWHQWHQGAKKLTIMTSCLW